MSDTRNNKDIQLNSEEFIEERVQWMKNEVADSQVVVAVSGGVDSVTTAVLAYKALGKRITAVFLDDGLMREKEPEAVVSILKKTGLNVKLYDVGREFFKALKNITDPELKRKSFRATFYQTLSTIVKDLGAKYLLQGTIAADIVETRMGVKTQHNVLAQIGIDPLKEYGYRVLEPLSTLYKDQVRMVARALKLPKEVVERRPFPGPGLAVRVLGEVTPERVAIVRKATSIVENETGVLPCFQALAVLMSNKATGLLKTGERRYGDIIVVRVVDSVNAMTATPTKIPWRILEKISHRIIQDLPSVSRVLYELTSKPPATIEFE